MKKKLIQLLMLCCITSAAFTQKKIRPYKCGWVIYDTAKLRENYEINLKYWNAKKGETIASIGAQNGNLEVRFSLFVDSINWTLQDIDSSCLNVQEFEKVKTHYETLGNKKINCSFTLLLGSETNTNLKANTYNRVLLINVYHELTKRKEMLAQINASLKSTGKLIVMEKMGKKRNKKRKDCKHIMPYEQEFLVEFTDQNFILISKKQSDKVTFYEFEKAG